MYTHYEWSSNVIWVICVMIGTSTMAGVQWSIRIMLPGLSLMTWHIIRLNAFFTISSKCKTIMLQTSPQSSAFVLWTKTIRCIGVLHYDNIHLNKGWLQIYVFKRDRGFARMLGPVLFRLALIILLAEAVHADWLVEQPAGSTDTLPYHPRMDWICNEVLYVNLLKFSEPYV